MHNENDWLDSNCRNFHVKFSLLFCLIWLYLNEKINKKERYSDNNFFFLSKTWVLPPFLVTKIKEKLETNYREIETTAYIVEKELVRIKW